MRVGFVVPDLAIGGGVSVALGHARAASQAGHEVTMVVTRADSRRVTRRARDSSVTTFSEAVPRTFDVVLASWWEDVPLLASLTAGHRAVLVQSLEDRLYPPGDPRVRIAREVLRVPLPGIAVSDWLRETMNAEYGRDLAVVKNGIDKAVFRAVGPAVAPRPHEGLRVLVEGPLGVWHKQVVPALRLARSIGSETWLLTSTDVGRISGVGRVFSRLGPEAVASVYRSCDVQLKLSLVEGLSLPLLEMFHCGGTVVAYELPAIQEYAAHQRNALLVPIGDLERAGRELSRLQDRRLLERLQAGGSDTAAGWPSVSEAGAAFVAALEEIVQRQPETDDDVIRALAALSRPPDAPTARSAIRNRVRDNRFARSVRHSAQVRLAGWSGRTR
jgi:O-antigen biosynthesis protein